MSPHPDTFFLILSQPVFVLSPECCVLSREATNTKPTIYRTQCEHADHYTNNKVDFVYGYFTKLYVKCKK